MLFSSVPLYLFFPLFKYSPHRPQVFMKTLFHKFSLTSYA